jgi:hypothetical protein
MAGILEQSTGARNRLWHRVSQSPILSYFQASNFTLTAFHSSYSTVYQINKTFPKLTVHYTVLYTVKKGSRVSRLQPGCH